jgi:hypothetical protein
MGNNDIDVVWDEINCLVIGGAGGWFKLIF